MRADDLRCRSSSGEVAALRQKSVRRSGPPVTQAIARRPGASIRCNSSPSRSHRMKASSSNDTAHTAPSPSRQMPSGDFMEHRQYDLPSTRVGRRATGEAYASSKHCGVELGQFVGRVGAEGVTRHASARQVVRARHEFANRVPSFADGEEAGYAFGSNPPCAPC